MVPRKSTDCKRTEPWGDKAKGVHISFNLPEDWRLGSPSTPTSHSVTQLCKPQLSFHHCWCFYNYVTPWTSAYSSYWACSNCPFVLCGFSFHRPTQTTIPNWPSLKAALELKSQTLPPMFQGKTYMHALCSLLNWFIVHYWMKHLCFTYHLPPLPNQILSHMPAQDPPTASVYSKLMRHTALYGRTQGRVQFGSKTKIWLHLSNLQTCAAVTE